MCALKNTINKNIFNKLDSNQIIEISDDDDNYEFECNGVQFDIATSSGKNLSNMIEKKNPLVDIEVIICLNRIHNL